MHPKKTKIVRIHDSLVDELEEYRLLLTNRYGRDVTLVEASNELGKKMREQKNGFKSSFGIFS